jgi:hypothetical protein
MQKNSKIYQELNYSGKGTNYLAVNKLTERGRSFTTAAERDRMVKWVPMKTNSRGYSFKRGEI